MKGRSVGAKRSDVVFVPRGELRDCRSLPRVSDGDREPGPSESVTEER